MSLFDAISVDRKSVVGIPARACRVYG